MAVWLALASVSVVTAPVTPISALASASVAFTSLVSAAGIPKVSDRAVALPLSGIRKLT